MGLGPSYQFPPYLVLPLMAETNTQFQSLLAQCAHGPFHLF